MYTHIYVCIYTYICVCIYRYIHAYAYIYTYIGIYIYTRAKGGATRRGGKEARIMMRVHGQDPSKYGKAGGDAQESILFLCMYPEDIERLR